MPRTCQLPNKARVQLRIAPPQFFCAGWGSGWKNSDHQARRAVIFKEPFFLSSARRGQWPNNSRGKTHQNHLPFANFPRTGLIQGMMNRLRMMVRIFPACPPWAPPFSFRTLVGKGFLLLKNWGDKPIGEDGFQPSIGRHGPSLFAFDVGACKGAGNIRMKRALTR